MCVSVCVCTFVCACVYVSLCMFLCVCVMFIRMCACECVWLHEKLHHAIALAYGISHWLIDLARQSLNIVLHLLDFSLSVCTSQLRAIQRLWCF